jgi:hypothetical protein
MGPNSVWPHPDRSGEWRSALSMDCQILCNAVLPSMNNTP